MPTGESLNDLGQLNTRSPVFVVTLRSGTPVREELFDGAACLGRYLDYTREDHDEAATVTCLPTPHDDIASAGTSPIFSRAEEQRNARIDEI